MPDQETCAPPVILTLPGQINAVTAEQAAIRPGGPLHRITEFADIHPLLAVYPTPQRAIKADYPSHPAIVRRPGGHHRRIAI